VEDLESQIQTARTVLAKACRDLKEFFRALQLQWVQHVEGPSESKTE